jgi:simple sugar transport system permease protein
MSKRTEVSNAYASFIRITAVLLALITSGIFISLLHLNPLEVYGSMVEGAFGSVYGLQETIIKTVPLVIASLGIAVAFKMSFWNIGAEGQILMGAFSASFFALRFPDLPRPILLTIMMIAAVIGGGLWGLIPAIFKAKFGTNETIFTLMMNYIALKWITYLQYGPWKDPNALGFPKIPNFSDNAILPMWMGIHTGWIIMIVLAIIMYFFLNHTKKGYEIGVIGESVDTARYAGMDVSGVILSALFISGGIAGLAGMIEASGVSNTLTVEVSGGIGFTAIITTWLSGLSAPLIVIVSFLFAALIQGGSFIQTAFQIPQAAAEMLQGMILFFVLGSEFFVRYRVEFVSPKKLQKEGA